MDRDSFHVCIRQNKKHFGVENHLHTKAQAVHLAAKLQL